MSSILTTSRGALTIRAAVPDDAEALRELRIAALTGHPEAFSSDPTDAAAQPPAHWAERVSAYAADSSGVISIACAGAQLVGMGGLVRGASPKTRHAALVWGMYVHPDWRGLGVAGELLEQDCAWARAHGVAMVKLAVVTTNAPAIRCYARCGFNVYGVEPETLCVDGVYYDELLMLKRL